MRLEDMKVGGFYRLLETVEYEHQDHYFVHPAGLIVRLDCILEHTECYNERWASNEDGYYLRYDTREIKVCHFVCHLTGMSYPFNLEIVTPATEEEVQTIKLKSYCYPC